MSCACHGKKGEKVEGRAEPDAQCSTCALKHVEMAMEAWGEFLYEEDTRRWCARHLRLAVEHLKTDHRDLALKCREAATTIELATDNGTHDVHDQIAALYNRVLEVFKTDHPDYLERLEKLKDNQEN